MSSYRFCRTDDVPLLVDAYNRCYRVHFPDLPPLTVQGFKRAIRELDLWCSSCMIAAENGDPVAVLLAAKRDGESLVYRLGVRPGHQRREHARHLLTSLSAKLAILGPRRLVAEVPAGWTGARALLEGCGYRPERDYFDFECGQPTDGTPLPPEEIIMPVTVDDLVVTGALDEAAPRCWERSPRALIACREQLRGLAIATDVIEAWMLYRDGDTREVVALGTARPEQREPLLGMLLAHLIAADPRPLAISRISPHEIPCGVLERGGCRQTGKHIGYAAEAGPS